jgi:hypothetical protein
MLRTTEGRVRRRGAWTTIAAAAVLLACGATGAGAETLNVLDLGPAGNAGQAGWYGVNDSGVVAGTQLVGRLYRAATWTNGNVALVGIDHTNGDDIDATGEVFGFRDIYDDDGNVAQYPWYADANGGQHTDQSVGGDAAVAYRLVSPGGTVLGHDSLYGASWIARPPYGARTELPFQAGSVNDAGHAVGAGVFYDGTTTYPVNLTLTNNGHVLNRHDDFVGLIASGADQGKAAISHAGAGVTLLPNPYADLASPSSINDDGTIVGATTIGGTATAIEWRPDGSVVTLDSLLPGGSPWHLSAATEITNTGYILGYGSINGELHYYLVAGHPGSVVSGRLTDRDNKPLGATRLTIAGTGDDGTAFSRSILTDPSGGYSLTVAPGTYTATPDGDPPGQNGGTWVASPCPGAATAVTGACALGHVTGSAAPQASFVYTQCSATARHPNGRPPTGCPIVFVPGFLGSRITCSTRELWPGLPIPGWATMALQRDGRTNTGAPGSCAATAGPVPGQDGVVAYVGGAIDVYAGALRFLNQIAPGRVYAYPYDWRRSVYDAVDGLDKVVDQARSDTGANRVVVMAHSMGGLVTRAYVDGTAHADKVTRVLTLGTPYWGAPKSHFALLGGYTDTNNASSTWTGLDLVTDSQDLEALARTAAGLYWLYPSARLGPWLSVSDLGHGRLRAGGVDQWVRSLGGASGLLDAAQAGHAALDTLKTNDIDYAVMVGAGTPTVTGMDFDSEGNEHQGVGFWASIHFGSGDGTVPLTSATMGVSAGAPAIASTYYACGVGHVALPDDPAVQLRVKGYLLDGDAVSGPDSNCPFTGTEIVGARIPPARLTARASATTAAGTMTIAAARAAGLITTYSVGDEDIIVLDDRHPVTLAIDARKLALQVTRVGAGVSGSAAKPKSYGPVTGALTIGTGGGAIKNGRKVLKASRPSTAPPVTVAHVTRSGARYRVRLTARSRNGASTTFYRLGRAASIAYRKPFVVTRRQLATLRFASIDGFGHQEKPRKARLPKAAKR